MAYRVRIWDTFLLGSGPADLDLLECRLYEYGDDDPFHMHVIVEGDVTFSGLPKPYWYLEQRERFSPWADKIHYIPFHPVADEPGKQPGEAWAREHSSRQACRLGLAEADPGDLIVHGDCDEILTAEAAARLSRLPSWLPPGTDTPVKLRLRHFSFAADWQQPWMWPAPSVARLGQVASFTDLRENGWPAAALPGGNAAGWHLSFLGGYDAIELKARSFSHTEVADMVCENADRYLVRGEWIGRDPDGNYYDWAPMQAVDVDETWPRWVHERRCPPSWFRPRTVR